MFFGALVFLTLISLMGYVTLSDSRKVLCFLWALFLFHAKAESRKGGMVEQACASQKRLSLRSPLLVFGFALHKYCPKGPRKHLLAFGFFAY
jgi:hypothetical protein